jgi:hypothetical protein
LSNTAIRSFTGIKAALAVSVVFSTKSMIAFLLPPSYHYGSGSDAVFAVSFFSAAGLQAYTSARHENTNGYSINF